MLRHLRMAPATQELPKAEGYFVGLLRDWIQPISRYRILHNPTPRDRVCICTYPLYTLRSSHRSPYDEPNYNLAGQDTVYVNSTGSSASVAPSKEGGDVNDPAEQLSPASPDIVSDSNVETGRNDNEKICLGEEATRKHTSAFLTSFGHLPSLRARWAVRRRRGGRLPAAVQSPDETCYRCDICDGLQRSAEEVAKDAAAAAGAVQSGLMSNTAQASEWNAELEDEDEAEETVCVGARGEGAAEAEEEEERYGFTTATDIANTAMEDADVAELRHLDPFHVEVFGRPSWTGLLKRASREVQAQAGRCGLRPRDASRYAAQANASSELSRQCYRRWVRQEVQRAREDQRRCVAKQAEESNRPPLGTQPAVGPGGEAILRSKVDTLHMAGYLGRYAMAAYGLPFELNFFSSVRELTKLMGEPRRRYVCANSEEQLESMRRMLQGEEPDALLECVASRYSLRVGQPNWALFLDHAARRVVLTFRGSLTPADLVVDVMEGYANVKLEVSAAAAANEESPGLCTAIPLGFYESVVEAGTQLLPILSTIHAQYDGYELCITGHSLGGIQASVFHLLYAGPWRASLHSTSSVLRRPASSPAAGALPTAAASGEAAPHVPFSRVVTCTFGAAPVVETKVLPTLNTWLQNEERRSGSRLIALSHGMDIVSRLQMHTIQETFLRADRSPLEGRSATSCISMNSTVGNTTASEDEKTDKASTVSLSSKTDSSVVPVLAIPGSLYNMTTGTRRRHLLSVPPSATTVRETMILQPEAMLQHFPSLYLRGLNELLQRYEGKLRAVTAGGPSRETEPGTPMTPNTTSAARAA